MTLLLTGAGNSGGGGGGAAVAPTVTAEVTSVFAPNGNSNTINIGAGDLVVIIVTGYSLTSQQTALSAHLGAFTNYAYSGNGGQILYARNSGGALTAETIVMGSSQASWHVYSISGATASNPPFDGSTFIPSTGSAQSLAASLTTTNPGNLLLANSINTSSTDAGWTATAAQTAYGEFNEYKKVTSTGTYTAWSGVNIDGSSFITAVKGV